MEQSSILLDNCVKFREGKKWKQRLCILKKLSPVADCLHLLVYKESLGSKKHNKEKASILLEKYCGVETGYQVDKEQNVLAILCVKQVVLLAFPGKNILIDWLVLLREHLGQEKVFHATLIRSPTLTKLQQGPVRLFVVNKRISLIAQIPPVILLSWLLSDLRKFGALDSDKFCLEGGTRAGAGNGLFAFLTDYGGDIEKLLNKLSLSGCQSLQRRRTHTGCISSSSSQSSLATLSPRSPCSPVFTFPPTHEFQASHHSFGDLGASNSEIQKCLDRQHVQRSISEDKSACFSNLSNSNFVDITDSPSFKLNQKCHLYENVFTSQSGDSPNNSNNKNSKVSKHNLPIAHGHSKSLGCEPEIYMDLSDILRKKTKQTSSSSTSVLSRANDISTEVPKLTPLQKDHSKSGSSEKDPIYENSVFINQLNSPNKSHGGMDLLSEILKECKLDQAAFKTNKGDNFFLPQQHQTPNVDCTSRCQVDSENSNKSSQFNSFINVRKKSTNTEKVEHSYCNFPLDSTDQKDVGSSVQLLKNTVENKNNEQDDKKIRSNSCKTATNIVRSQSKSQLKTNVLPVSNKDVQNIKSRNHKTLSFSAPNLCDRDKINESQDFGGKNHLSSTMKSSDKKCVKRNSRSLPDFDPLRPLEFVDLSRFDGKDDEGYSYRVKTGPNPQVIPVSSTRGYDNIPRQSEASYANVNMQTPGKKTILGYDNIPENPGINKTNNAIRNYDNLRYSNESQFVDNRPDCVKVRMEYENIPFHPERTADSKAVYENWSKSDPLRYTRKNNLLTTNVPPPVPPKASKSKKKSQETGSKLPYGGVFAIHGSLRRPKPLHREVPVSNNTAGDIAGSYVLLKGEPKQDKKSSSETKSKNNLGVANLAESANLMRNQNAMGTQIHANNDVELVILEMSEDDPQRDNIANMLVERQQRPTFPIYGRTGPPQPLPPRRFSIHSVTTTTTPANFTTTSSTNSDLLLSPAISADKRQITNKTQLDLSHNSAFTPLEKRNGNHETFLARKSATVGELVNGNFDDTYGSTQEVVMHGQNTQTQGRIRSNEYIDMSQPLRLPTDRSVSPDKRNNSASPHSRSKQSYNQVTKITNKVPVTELGTSVPLPYNAGTYKVGDSPYMDMGFMMYANKSEMNTPEKKKISNVHTAPRTPEKTYLNVSQVQQSSSTLPPHKKLHHSKSLDNELDEVYIDSDILEAAHREHRRSPMLVESDQQYLPMSTINRHNSKSPEINIDEDSGSSDDEVEEKPLKPFDGLLDFPPYTEKKTTLSLSPKKFMTSSKSCKNVEEDNISIGSSVSVSSSTVRRGSKGLFARLMRRNSSAKDLAKMTSKSEEDILEAGNGIEEAEQKEYSKEPIYAQIPEKECLREPVTLPLKKKSYSNKNTESFLLDPVVQNERIKLLTGKVCLEHGNLTDEQKQSCASLLSERSMTPPTPPPNIPLPPPPLPPPRVGREVASDAPMVPPKTYKNRCLPSAFSQSRKPEPEYVDIDDDDFPVGTGRETPASLSLSVSPDPPRIIDGVAYLDDGKPVPPPRPPSCSSTNTDGFSEEETQTHSLLGNKPRPFNQVQRSLSLRSNHERIYSGNRALTEPSSPMRLNENSSFGSPTASTVSNVLRPRTGKQYSTVDRKRWLEREDHLSSGPSSGSQTPASPLVSPTKSPSSSQATVFNFDSASIKMSRHHHQHSGSDTDSPRSPMMKPGFKDPDHVYMNLTFPKSPRSASPVVIDTLRHRSGANMADSANVVLNYAEIDLSRSSSDKSSKTEKALNKSNIDYAMIDMVATAAASRASKQHDREREYNLRQKEQLRHYRKAESSDSKENSARKSSAKDRSHRTDAASSSASSSPLAFGKDKKLGRSNSAVSRVSSNSVDRKHSLPV